MMLALLIVIEEIDKKRPILTERKPESLLLFYIMEEDKLRIARWVSDNGNGED